MLTNTLHTKNLKQNFGEKEKTQEVLRGITIAFDQGESYAITGVSGSGKSTFLHLLGGLDTPTSGTVLFNDANLSTTRKETLLNTQLGFVFQFHYLLNELSVTENIMLMGLIKGNSKTDCQEHARELLNHMGLSDKAQSFPYQLSGGEQQRVSIARAVFNKPAFLLADEPTGNLDTANAKQIVTFLLNCQKEWNMGIILCSHDKAVYGRMNHIFELTNGQLKAQ